MPRRESASTESARSAEQGDVYWPYHLLGEDCPRCRILTWGYDSKVSNFFHGSANKNHIFAHSRDLLSDLKGRRLLCVRDQRLAQRTPSVKLRLIIILHDNRKIGHWSSWHTLWEVKFSRKSSVTFH